MEKRMGRLVLTVKEGGYIVIDNKIQISVQKFLDDCYNNIQLVVEAPKDVRIVREELLSAEQIQECRENGLSLN